MRDNWVIDVPEFLDKIHKADSTVEYSAVRVWIILFEGSPLSVSWTKEDAESMVEALIKDSAWEEEITFRKEHHKELPKFEVIESILEPLSVIGFMKEVADKTT